MIVIKRFTFDAAHFVPSYHGKCEALHGHTYRLAVAVEGDLDAEGMVIDFAVLKDIVKKNAVDLLDHHLLNDIIKVPTAENIAVFIWDKIAPHLSSESYHLDSVEVWETENNGCIYRGE